MHAKNIHLAAKMVLPGNDAVQVDFVPPLQARRIFIPPEANFHFPLDIYA